MMPRVAAPRRAADAPPGSTTPGPITPGHITVAGVSKSFGGTAVLRDVAIEVPEGAMLALLGPSGCGKTTLLRIVAGLERPDAGEVRVGSRVLVGPSTFVAPDKRQVGLVFQDGALFPHLSVAGNVGYGLHKVSRAERAGRVADALAMVDLAGFEDRSPATLSGGQQQRVALARALAPRPSVLLLDEPFSNLDAALRGQLRTDLHRLLVDLGITTVFVTHDQEEAFVLGDEVAVLRRGRVVQRATPADLYREPTDRWVATFVGAANLVPGRADGNRATTVLGAVPLASGAHGPVDVLVRPESIEASGLVGHPAAGAGVGTVELVEFRGSDTSYLVAVHGAGHVAGAVGGATDGGAGGGAGEVLEVRRPGPPVLARGDRVELRYVGPPTVAFASAPGDGDPTTDR